LFADGVYEVIPAYQGVLFRLEEHLQRLQASLDAIMLPNPLSRDDWSALLSELVQRNGGGNIYVYLQVTRGVASKRDHAFPTPPVPPTIFAMTGHIAAPAADLPDTTPGVS